MPLKDSDLAKKLQDAIPLKTDGEGKSLKVSDQMKNYAKGIIEALKIAVVSHPTGTVVGVTAVGAPLSAGAANGGIVMVQPAMMVKYWGVGLDPRAVVNLQKEANALASYLSTGLVNFPVGSITGQCTSTPTSPGPLVAGAGSNGKISGLTGAAAMAYISSALGFTGPDMLPHYNALINYVLAEATVTYATGSVVGVCPPISGPLGAGTAAGGTIA